MKLKTAMLLLLKIVNTISFRLKRGGTSQLVISRQSVQGVGMAQLSWNSLWAANCNINNWYIDFLLFPIKCGVSKFRKSFVFCWGMKAGSWWFGGDIVWWRWANNAKFWEMLVKICKQILHMYNMSSVLIPHFMYGLLCHCFQSTAVVCRIQLYNY